jgi:hypothetical protein
MLVVLTSPANPDLLSNILAIHQLKALPLTGYKSEIATTGGIFE